MADHARQENEKPMPDDPLAPAPQRADPWATVAREPDDENPAFYTRDVYDADAVDRARKAVEGEIDGLRAAFEDLERVAFLDCTTPSMHDPVESIRYQLATLRQHRADLSAEVARLTAARVTRDQPLQPLQALAAQWREDAAAFRDPARTYAGAHEHTAANWLDRCAEELAALLAAEAPQG